MEIPSIFTQRFEATRSRRVPILVRFAQALEEVMECSFVLTSTDISLTGQKRKDTEHLHKGAEDWAIVLPKGSVVSGIRGYRASGTSPRFSTDLWFILITGTAYSDLIRKDKTFANVSILIEHDHLHVVNDGRGGVWIQIGYNGDPVTFKSAFKIDQILPILRLKHFKPVS